MNVPEHSLPIEDISVRLELEYLDLHTEAISNYDYRDNILVTSSISDTIRIFKLSYDPNISPQVLHTIEPNSYLCNITKIINDPHLDSFYVITDQNLLKFSFTDPNREIMHTPDLIYTKTNFTSNEGPEMFDELP
jgi:hypothetical protein